MYRSLLVPLDGSEFSEQALPLAAIIARRAGSAMEVVHVHVPFEYYTYPSPAAPQLDKEARQAMQRYLEGVVQRLASDATGPVTSTLLIGNAADVLQDHALSKDFDLIVMVTHGRGPMSRFWLGSVADHLMRRLPMPVLLTSPRETPQESGVEPILRRVLIPLDGSELAEEILEPALSMGALMNAEYTLLRIVEQVPVADDSIDLRARVFTPIASREIEEWLKQREAEAQSYLDDVANRLRSRSVAVEVRVLRATHPAVAILDEARDQKTDLIAMATHGRGGVARLSFGSIADKVVRGATMPVLVFRPGQRPS